MSTEHVEDLLSAYLDNALSQEDQSAVSTHLQTCASCDTILSDFRRFDALLAQQPRVSPGANLRQRIFSSPEYLELTTQVPEKHSTGASDLEDRQTLPQKRARIHNESHPHLVALSTKAQPSPLSMQETKARVRTPQRRHMHIQRFMQVAIAACLLLTIGVGSFIGWNLWQEQGKTTHTDGIIPPQSLHQGGPLPAGTRFVFLKDGGLWSTPEDGSAQAIRLTPALVNVAPHWVVNPAPTGHNAGNLLAYVDTKQGYLHTLRSDGQSDTTIRQLLVQNPSAASWNTSAGQSVLTSLSWSPDGRTLAFVGTNAKTSTVYMYSTNTNSVQPIALPDPGSISHLVWSPNGVRIAFGLTHTNGTTSILDYNVSTQEVLTVVPTIAGTQNLRDVLLTLDWTPQNDAPALTWSVGTQGHVHTIWLRHVGTTTSDAQTPLLNSGDYTQAVYSRYGEHGTGEWLLDRALSTNTDILLSLALTGEVRTIASGSQIGVVQWASDGKHITYFDNFASGTGTLHSVDTTTSVNTLIVHAVQSTPAPVWSADGKQLLYHTGTHNVVVDTQNNKIQLPITAPDATFAWSTMLPHRAIIALQTAVYLVDTQHNTAKALSIQGATGPIVWTQVP